MTQPAAQEPQGGTVHHMPSVVITEGTFEGKEVQGTVLTVAGAAKLVPNAMPGNDDHRVVTVDDILTIQIDVKVTGVGYETDSKGNLTRVQRARPIEGTATVMDVIRKHQTHIR